MFLCSQSRYPLLTKQGLETENKVQGAFREKIPELKLLLLFYPLYLLDETCFEMAVVPLMCSSPRTTAVLTHTLRQCVSANDVFSTGAFTVTR